MIAHGVSTAGLFVLAGILNSRLDTRNMRQMGGLWTVAPHLGAMGIFFALAAIGLPGLGNFVGEFLILLGAFKTQPILAIAATAGMIASVIYALWMVQRIFQGPTRPGVTLSDLTSRETIVFAALVTALLWLGLFPNPVFNLNAPAVTSLTTITTQRGP
jgi:NADH-quinone oxidoreductase subunit M